MAGDEIRSREWIDKIEELVRQAESVPDPNARRIAIELLQAVLDFHAAGLNRVMEIIADSGTVAPAIIERIASEDLTRSMLLLHDLHPDDLETRVKNAVGKLQEMFASLGAKLSLLSIESDTVQLQFDSTRTWAGTPVKASVENAIFDAAPEIETVLIEGLKEPSPGDFVPVSDLLAGSPA